MLNPRRLLTYSIVTLTSLVVLGAAAFALDRLAHSDEIVRGVSANGVDLGGLNDSDALTAILGIQEELNAETLTIVVADQTFQLTGAEVGYTLDTQSAIEEAKLLGRQGSIVSQFSFWATHLFSAEQISLTGEISMDGLEDRVGFFEQESQFEPPFEGDIVVNGTTPEAIYPTPGRGINARAAGNSIELALNSAERPESLTLQVVEVLPTLSVTDVDNAMVQARLLLGGPIDLTRTDPDFSATLTEMQLARAFITSVETSPVANLEVSFDPAVIEAILAPQRSGLEAPPKDAEIDIDDDDNIVITPGRPGALIDATLAAEAAETAARTGTRTAELPFEAGAMPEVTTEDIEALGIIEKLSEFTTFHPCCAPRVENIHLFADIVDGALVMPGETLSLNDFVGERTSERGFLPAPTIIGGKLVDTVGGGVSQFATTFYNAIFDAGLEDVTHKAHSYYFTRYPEGIEATINFPEPDLVFRNDTDAAVLIKTEYTDESITVKFFGDNGGREVTTRSVSDRFGFRDFPTEYTADPTLDPADGEHQTVSGIRGWSVKVTRVITNADGSTDEQTWVVVYRPRPREVDVHPCLIPEGSGGFTGEECPVTTTTTSPDTTPTTTAG